MDGRIPLIDPGDDGWTLVAEKGFTLWVDEEGELPLEFAESVARGLEDQPRWLDCRYLYDSEGSEIYEQITHQPEYYPTRTESAILERHAGRIRELAGDTTVVELGSGSSTKTRHVLDAWGARGRPRYVPIDISRSALEAACRSLTSAYPQARVEGIVASYERGLALVSAASPLTLLFLGSTVGNLNNDELDTFYDRVSRSLEPGDSFVLGIDLVKDPACVEAAYNDAAGWTARFTKNLFARMNRELGTALRLGAIEHVALYNDRMERIEIYARFLEEMTVDLPLIDSHFRIAAGEMILIEISRKFRTREMAANAARFGFELEGAFEDPGSSFAVLLLRKVDDVPVVDGRRRMIEHMLLRTREQTLGILGSVRDLEPGGANDPGGHLVAEIEAIAGFEERWVTGGGEGRTVPVWPTAELGCPLCELPAGPSGPRTSRLEEALSGLGLSRAESLRLLGNRTQEGGAWADADETVARLLVEHEGHHQERILEILQEWGDPSYQAPTDGTEPPRPDRPAGLRSVLVPGGSSWVGTDGEDHSLDWAHPRHRVDLPGFRIDDTQVSNGYYAEFLADDGYRRRDLWSEAGWAWRESSGVEHPGNWIRSQGRWQLTSFGERRPMDPARPVVHVSFHEAEAFARWRGARLPTEQEWEKAAAWDPARVRARSYPWGDRPAARNLANIERRLAEPAPVGSFPQGRSFYGCYQMIGDVWEWTSSSFRPYPPVAQERRGQHSSETGTVMVLRGGSWATPALAIRSARRRAGVAGTQRLFAGFRCVTDA